MKQVSQLLNRATVCGLIAACLLALGATTLSAQGTMTVQGVLLKFDRKPLPYTEIELVPVASDEVINDPRLISATATNGKFFFSDVPPGRYTLSINFEGKPTELSPYDAFFYPGSFKREEATVLTIDAKTRIRNLVFWLPPALIKKTIYGRVLWEDGRPAPEASIGIWDLKADRYKLFGKTTTGPDGRFTVIGFQGRRYQLGALVFDRIPRTIFDHQPKLLGGGESEPFVLENGQNEIEIRVGRSRDIKAILDKFSDTIY